MLPPVIVAPLPVASRLKPDKDGEPKCSNSLVGKDDDGDEAFIIVEAIAESPVCPPEDVAESEMRSLLK